MGKSKCRHLSWPSPWENPVAVVATCRILPALVASSTRDGKQAKSRPHPPSDVNSGHASRRTNRSAFANVLLGRCKRTGEPVGALGCVGASGMSRNRLQGSSHNSCGNAGYTLVPMGFPCTSGIANLPQLCQTLRIGPLQLAAVGKSPVQPVHCFVVSTQAAAL